MSLNKVTKIYVKPLILDKPGIGYQVFEIVRFASNPIKSLCHEYYAKIGELCRSSEYPNIKWSGGSYPNGFHIFKKYEDAKLFMREIPLPAENYVVFKVEYNNIVALGFQTISEYYKTRGAVVIARVRRILEKVRSI